jgi:hypothetical protein
MSPMLTRCKRTVRVPDPILAVILGAALGTLCAAFI